MTACLNVLRIGMLPVFVMMHASCHHRSQVEATIKLDHATTGFGTVNTRDLQMGSYFIWDPERNASSQIIGKGTLEKEFYDYPTSETAVGEKTLRGVSGVDVDVKGFTDGSLASLKTTVGSELEVKATSYTKAEYNGGGRGEGNILNHKKTLPFRQGLPASYVGKYFVVVTEEISAETASVVYGGLLTDKETDLSKRSRFKTTLTLANNEVITVNVFGGNSINQTKGKPFVRLSFYQLGHDSDGATQYDFVEANLTESQKKEFVKELSR